MANALDELLTSLNEHAKRGIDLRTHLVLRALRIGETKQRILGLLERHYSLVSCEPIPSDVGHETTVKFTFLPPPGTAHLQYPGFFVTFCSSTNELISIRDLNGTTDATSKSYGALPLTLSVPSFAEAAALADSDTALQETRARRAKYTTELMLRAPRLDTTEYTTESSTGYQTATTTQYPTSGITTPNDNDTRTDERGDTETDNRTDYSPDTRDDPDNDAETRLAPGQIRAVDEEH